MGIVRVERPRQAGLACQQPLSLSEDHRDDVKTEKGTGIAAAQLGCRQDHAGRCSGRHQADPAVR